MRKTILSFGLALSVCAAAGSALAAPTPISPILTTTNKLPVIQTTQPITTTVSGTQFVIDPSLLPDLSVATTSGGPVKIDPGILGNLKPLPLGEIVIPPLLLKGPLISDIALSTDGKLLQVTWTTDKLATSKVEYGVDDAYGKTLEDKTKVTKHSLLIPAAPGELHLRISSTDSLGKVSQTEDIAVTIPDLTAVVADKTATTTGEAVTTTEEEINPLAEEKEETAKPEAKPAVNEPPLVQVQTGPSTMTLVGGAVMLLIIGILAGALVSRSKKPSEPKPEQK